MKVGVIVNLSPVQPKINGINFVSRLAASRPKKLAPLANELVKLNSVVVSMGFSGALSSFSHFS